MVQHEGCERLWHSTRAAHGCETWRYDWGSDVCDLSSAEAVRLGLSSAKMKIWALLVTFVTGSLLHFDENPILIPKIFMGPLVSCIT